MKLLAAVDLGPGSKLVIHAENYATAQRKANELRLAVVAADDMSGRAA
jgi:hypothetical protein